MNHRLVCLKGIQSNTPVANWTALRKLVADVIVDENWLAMLDGLRKSVPAVDIDVAHSGMMLGMEDAPASRSQHHAQRGGLVQHLLEMWAIHEGLRDTMPVPEDKQVLKAIVLHDLEKAWRGYQTSSGILGVARTAEVDENKYMTAPAKIMYMVSHWNIVLDIELVNAVLLSHGGYTKCPPQYTTVLAKYVYLLDELSANVLNRLHTHNPMRNDL